MPDTDPTRRTYLLTLAGLSSVLAGCSSSTPEDSTTTTQSAPEPTTKSTDTPSTSKDTSESGGGEAGSRPPRPDYDGWLSQANSDPETVAAYGQTDVTVTSIESSGQFTFDPVAVQVDPGATVTWDVDDETAHDVVAKDGIFESDVLEADDATFAHTFEDTGIHRYVCRPHEQLGQIGAVVVGTDYPTVLPDAPLAWSTNTYDAFRTPHLDGTTIYAVHADGVLALDAADGTDRWTAALEPLATDSGGVTPNGDTVYVASETNTLHAFDTTDGTEQWTYTTETDIDTNPVVDDDTVYVAGDRGLVYAVNGDGTSHWDTELPSNHIVALTRTSDALYAAGGVQGRGSLYKLDTTTGDTEWRYKTTGIDYTFLKPTIASDTAYVSGARGGFHAIDTTDGTKQWTAETTTGLERAPIVSNGTVYVRHDDRTLHALDAPTGDIEWQFRAETELTIDPIAGDSQVYAATDSGVYTIDATTGDERNHHQTLGDVYRTSAIHGDTVYVGDWGVWALDVAQATPDGGRVSLPVTIQDVTLVGNWPEDVFVLTT